MGEIVLSAGVRQNLLSLQNTARLMGITQNRLATGKSVNSALDNPVNFFTAAGLNSRAGDLSALLDTMSNGVKTIEAANNGITGITRMIESMKSTLQQARQDKSFKSQTYTIDATTIGTATTKVLSLSGGSVGTTGVDIPLQTNTGGTPVAATAATLTEGAFSAVNLAGTAATAATFNAGSFSAVNLSSAGSAATAATFTAGSFSALDLSTGGDTINFTLTTDAGSQAITLDSTTAAANHGAVTAAEVASAINSQFGSAVATVDGSGNLKFTSATTGASSSVAITGFTAAGNATTSGIANNSATGNNAVAADTISFTLTTDTGTQAITLDSTTAAANHGAVTAAELASAINSQFGSAVASVNGSGNLTFASATLGASSSVAITGAATTGNATSSGIANNSDTGSAAVTNSISFTLATEAGSHAITLDSTTTAANHAAVTAAELASAINAQFGSTVAAVNGSGNLTFTSGSTGSTSSVAITGFAVLGGATGSGIGNGSDTGAPASVTGGTNVVQTVDQLVATINANASLDGKVQAANDNGKLRITNLSTATLNMAGIAAGAVDGSASTTTILGNDVRRNLVKQFNDLRDQLDKISDDSSFNGVNLLRGDKLKITFNETGTSTIDVQAKDEFGNVRPINSLTLNISFLQNSSVDDDSQIDTNLDKLSQSLNILRSQASNFGSHLSIVENRTEFTKSMINTLTTGADHLVLADTNEEGANMLALQTRQQLSTTALSLASQADQAVLRLFG